MLTKRLLAVGYRQDIFNRKEAVMSMAAFFIADYLDETDVESVLNEVVYKHWPMQL